MKRRLISMVTAASVVALMGACLLTGRKNGTYVALIHTSAVAKVGDRLLVLLDLHRLFQGEGIDTESIAA